MKLFTVIKWGHLVAFLAIWLGFIIKSKGYYKSSQISQVVNLIVYLIPMIFSVYIVKCNIEMWRLDMNPVRVWLFCDIFWFLCWVAGSQLFMLFAYLIKFKPITKNEQVLAIDTNVWNDRNTDDFLHYLKMEYFLITYMLTFIIVEICVSFTDIYEINLMGQRNWYPCKSTYLAIIIFRSFFLAVITYCMAIGKSIGSNLFIRKAHENDKTKSSCGGIKIKNLLSILVRLAIPAYVLSQFYGTR